MFRSLFKENTVRVRPQNVRTFMSKQRQQPQAPKGEPAMGKNWAAYWTPARRKFLKTINYTFAPMVIIMYLFTSGHMNPPSGSEETKRISQSVTHIANMIVQGTWPKEVEVPPEIVDAVQAQVNVIYAKKRQRYDEQVAAAAAAAAQEQQVETE